MAGDGFARLYGGLAIKEHISSEKGEQVKVEFLGGFDGLGTFIQSQKSIKNTG